MNESHEHDGYDHIFSVVGSVVVLQGLHIVADLNIASLLSKQPMDVEELASATGRSPEPLYRIMRLLVGHGIFSEEKRGVFANNEVSELLRDDVPFSMRALARMNVFEGFQSRCVRYLPQTIENGKSAFSLSHEGRTLWDYFTNDEEEGQEAGRKFGEATVSLSTVYDESLVSAFAFLPKGVYADVGGGNGKLLSMLLRGNADLRGVLFDRPEVVEEAKALVSSFGVEERCEFVPGSFLDSVPGGVDGYIMRHILHDWDDDNCLRILGNCRAASGDKPLYIIERVIDSSDRHSRNTYILDVWMMMLFDSAKERSREEYAELLDRSGYRLERVIGTSTPFSIIEAFPKN